jgi:Uri superfamily endonuclease
MKDPRIQTIESATTYLLRWKGSIVYVGCTTKALEQRLSQHIHEVANGQTRLPVYDYLRRNCSNPHDELTIEATKLDEEAAVEKYRNHIFNKKSGVSNPTYRGYKWSPAEVDILEEAETPTEAYKKLDKKRGPSRYEVFRAAEKLGLYSRRGHSYHKKIEDNAPHIRRLYTENDDITYADLRERFGYADGTLHKIINQQGKYA